MILTDKQCSLLGDIILGLIWFIIFLVLFSSTTLPYYLIIALSAIIHPVMLFTQTTKDFIVKYRNI